jgi:diguanylate cyclase (GGDEF)-like protein/PAS domain S-box-containing protein
MRNPEIEEHTNPTGGEEDLLWSVDLNFGLTSFNEAARRRFERNPGVQATAGMHPSDILPAEQAALWPPLYRRAILGGPFKLEYELPDHRMLELSFAPLLDAGEIAGVSVLGKDVTEQKRSEQALRAAEKKFREIVYGALEGIFQISLDSHLLSANPALARILGFASEQELIESLGNIAKNVWVDAAEHDTFMSQLHQFDTVRSYECRLRRKDGSIFWASVSSRKVLDADGNPLYLEGFLEDITERRRTMQELAEREERQRNIFQENGSIMLLVDPESGEIVDANKAATAYYGFKSEQLIGMNIDRINVLPPEEVATERHRALIEERNYFNFRHRLASGALRDVEVYSSPVQLGGRALLFSIVHDVTDRKHMEEMLRESEEHYRSTFEQASMGIVQISFEGRILRCNRRFAEIVGYSVEEICAMSIRQLTAPEDFPETAQAFAQLKAGKTDSATLEKRYLRKDGTPTWVKVTSSTQCDSHGKPLHHVGFIEDINEHKSDKEHLLVTNAALLASELRYRTAFQTSFDAISLSRLDDGQLYDVNRAYLSVYGYSREEVIGRSALDLNVWVTPEDRLRFIEILRAQKICQDMEWMFRRKNGEVFWALISSAQIELDGVPSLLSVVRDISATKAAEGRVSAATQALRKSEERYRIAFQTSLDAISIATVADGRYVEVNQVFLNTYGFEYEEVIGHTSLELNVWADFADRVQLMERLHRESACLNLQIHYRRKNGELFWGLLSVSLIEIEGVLCNMGVIRDISEAKAAEERVAAATLALQKSEERYRVAFQTSFDAISLSHRDDGRVVDINQAYLRVFGFQREEIIGNTSVDLGIWQDSNDRLQFIAALRNEAICQDFEFLFRRKNGESFVGLISATEIELDGVPSILSVIRDISRAKAAEQSMAKAAEALQKSEARYRSAFQTSIDSIAITTIEDGRYIDVNPAYLRIWGYERAEVIGRSVRELNTWVDFDERRQMLEVLKQHGACTNLEARFHRKNGEIFWGLASASLIELDGVPCLLSFVQDITAAKAAAEEIKSLAFYDPLTHLPNRRLLLDRLRHSQTASLRSGHNRALLFVDLDSFKMFNDSLGHQIGDLMLIEVARRMSGCVRQSDTVGRLGGDEFLVILEDLSSNLEEAATEARLVGEKILVALEQPYWLDSHECRGTASIGITIFGSEQQTSDEILQQADIAMYQAKSVGRGSLHFFAPMLQAAVHARAALEDDLRQAILSRQFVLYYQPQMDHSRMVACEALVRWNHPTRGLLAPGEFISLAEETGLILPLGNWVLENACEQIAAWSSNKRASQIQVAVNISARQFRQSEFVGHVLEALQRTGATPHSLILELTESTLLDDVDETVAKIAQLKRHGIGFSLDDFGTGYSSLSYLKRLPIDQLKIDRSFIHDILVDASSGAIARTIISLGRAIGLSIVAEGVETGDQRDFLAHLGCHIFQGYLFSPPLPICEFEARWLESKQ